MKRAAQTSRNKTTIAAFAALVAFYCIGLVVLFSIDAAFPALIDAPPIEGGVADFQAVDRDGRLTAITLSGEWEFFYNRHIVTDNDTGAPDGLMALPGKWTGKTFGDKKLPRSGYASYRATVKHIKVGEIVTCFADNSTVALRIFVNGKLCSTSGRVGKTAAGSVSGPAERVDFCIADGGDITVVIETGYTRAGGLTHAPCLSPAMRPGAYWIFLERMTVIAFGLTLGLFLTSVAVTLAFRKYDRDGSPPILIGMLCLHFFFSKDVTKALGLYGYGAVWLPALLTGALTVAVYTFRLLRYGGGSKTPFSIALGAIWTAASVAYAVLYGTAYTVIPLFVFLFSSLATLYPLLKSNLRPTVKAVYACVYLLTVCILTFEAVDGAGLLSFGTEYMFAFLLPIPIAAQVLLTVLQLNDKRRKLLRMQVLEAELESTRQRALLSQIKPHFVFNSLTAMQALYHKDVREGDAALENFAHVLRSSIDAVEGAETIPFDDEVQNVLRYFELQNLRTDGALTLLLDLEETAFEVPVLSLQPFVENAVKYAGTERIAGGCITLSSSRTESGILVKITDNGVGFDTSVPPHGVGMRNARERLARVSNATVQIDSAPNAGTQISIVFPATAQ